VQQALAETEPATAPARYSTAITVPGFVREEIIVLKGIAAHLVMRADDRVSLLAQQREIVSELVDAFWRAGPAELDPTYRADFHAAADDAGRLRAVIDQVASFTDPSAVNRHHALRRASSRPASSA
jgi:dGTPase